MKKMKLLTLTMSIFSMLVTSCSSLPKIEESKPVSQDDDYSLTDEEIIPILSNWNPIVTVERDENLDPVFDEMDPIDQKDRERLSSSMLDTPRGTQIKILFQNEAQHYSSLRYDYEKIVYGSDTDAYVMVTDADETPQDAFFETDGSSLSLSLNENYQYGQIYIINLQQDNLLMFENKDPSIQRLVIEIEDDPNEPAEIDECEYQDNVPMLSLDLVSNESVDENAIYSFEYNGDVPSWNEGDLFLVKNNQANDELSLVDFYGEYISQEKLPNGHTKVYYEQPGGEKMFKSLRRKKVQEVDFTNVEILVDPDTITNELRYSSTIRGFTSFFAKQARNKDPNYLGGILDSIHIDFKFNYYDGKFTFTFSISLSNIELYKNESGDTGLYLAFKYVYTRSTQYFIDFDVGLKKKWHIPVGVSYKIKIVEEISESHAFQVVLDAKAIQEEKDEEEIKTSLVNEVSKAKAGEDNFIRGLYNSDKAKEKTEGNKTTIPLFKLTIPDLAPLMFDIKLDFIIDFTVEAMFVVKKQWKSNRVILNFSNKKGGDSDTHQDVKEASSWDFYFMGMAECRLAVRLTGSLYIAGTYKYLHVELYAELYVKIGIQGNVSATYKTGELNGNYAIDLYVLMGCKVGIDIVVAIFDFDFSKDLFKTYIFRLHFQNELQRYSDDAVSEIDLNRTVANVDDFDILKFRIWDGVKMIMDIKTYKASDEVSIIESWLGDLSFKMFEFEVCQGSEDKITISNDGEIRVKDGTDATFDAKFKVKVSGLAGFIDDKEITIHFDAPDAHHIYIFDDDAQVYVDMGKYRPGHDYTLQYPKERAGYRFLNYIVHFEEGIGTEMYPGETFDMPDHDLYIDINWHKLVYYTVAFYDGHNNLISLDSHVEENTSAREPSPEIRDQFMEGYFFIGWDKSFANVNSDLVVRGIYVKVGD